MTTISNGSGSLSSSLLDSINGANTSGANGANGANGTGGTDGANGSSSQDLQSTFLQLLVAEMKNQDPTSPMDSSQMTSQLAQINTVSGIGTLNTTLTSLATQLNAGQQVSASELIGKSVLAPGNDVTVASGTPTQTGIKLDSAASSVTVSVLDSSGKTVRTINLGATAAGVTPLNWDGKNDSGEVVADGDYTLKASALNGTTSVTATTLAQEQVTSAIQQASGAPGLVLSNGSTVSLGSVAQIL